MYLHPEVTPNARVEHPDTRNCVHEAITETITHITCQRPCNTASKEVGIGTSGENWDGTVIGACRSRKGVGQRVTVACDFLILDGAAVEVLGGDTVAGSCASCITITNEEESELMSYFRPSIEFRGRKLLQYLLHIQHQTSKPNYW